MKFQGVKRFISLLLCCCIMFLSGCTFVGFSDADAETTSKKRTTTSRTTEGELITADTTTDTTAPEITNGDDPTVPYNPAQPSSSPTSDSSGSKLIALTFDDGPHASVTGRILDTLERYDAKATFFVVGNRVADYPGVVRRARDMGCEIGTHTWSHKNLTKLTTDEMNLEMENSVRAISNVTGITVGLMRPPEGAHNESVRANMPYPMIMWSVDSLDWKYRDSQKDYNEVMNNVFDGAIILMHDLYPATAAAVERLVPDLIARGYKFVTVSELMASRGVNMQNGTVYFSAVN